MKENSSEIVELCSAFRIASLNQYAATLQGDYKEGDRHVLLQEQAFAKLIAIGIGGRDGLLDLLEDQAPEVRLSAACYSASHNREASLRVMRQVSKRKDLIGFIAQHAIKRVQEGKMNFG